MLGRRGVVSLSVMSFLVAACTPGGGDSGDGAPDEDAPSVDGRAPNAPTGLEVGLVGGEGRQLGLEVSFVPSASAEAHLVTLEDSEPIRVEPEDCSEDGCSVMLDRLTVADAGSVTVSAVSAEAVSSPSDEVGLPAWPEPPEPDLVDVDGDEPVSVVVTRFDEAAGRLVVAVETVEPGEGIEARLADLEAAEDVIGVELDLSGFAATQAVGDPDDYPHYPEGLATWQMEALNFQDLPDEPRGEGVTVAVIDTGVYEDHPALQGADVSQTNVRDPGENVSSDHGTMATSLIVGQPEGRVPGVAPAATILVYDVFSGSTSFSTSALVDAIHQAVDDGADVINMSLSSTCFEAGIGPLEVSWGCPGSSLATAVEYAESEGVVVVAAAGNDGDSACPNVPAANQNHWPAKYPTVIAVGYTTRSGEPGLCSPEKDYIDVLAPGDKLLVASGSSDYTVSSGTSLAAPLVSGLVAVILAERPDLTPEEIRALLANATGEHGRLIPAALLLELGILEDEQIGIDLTSGAQLTRFSVRFEYEDRTYSPTWRDYQSLLGILLLHDDGTVTGSGRVWRPNTAENYAQCPWQAVGRDFDFFEHCRIYPNSYHVACPGIAGQDRYLRFNPTLWFAWDVPVTVSGERVDDRGDLDLTFSVGVGATPEVAGELPGMEVILDDFDDCPAAHAWEDENLLGGANWTIEEALTTRNEVVDGVQQMYRRLIGLSPLALSDASDTGILPRVGSSASYRVADDLRMTVVVGGNA